MSSVQTKSPDRWDLWLNKLELNAGFCQTTHWANLNHKINKKNPYYFLSLSQKQEIASAALFFKEPVGMLRRVYKSILNRPCGILESHEGPVFAKETSIEAVEKFIEDTEKLAHQLQVEAIRYYGKPCMAEWSNEQAIYQCFLNAGYQLIPWETAVVTLESSEQALFSSFEHSARKAINNCKRNGIRIHRCSSKDEFVEMFLKPSFEMKRGKSYAKKNPQEALWDLDKDKHYHFFVALDKEERPLATLGTYHFNGMVTEIISSRLPLAMQQKIPAQDLLHHEAMVFHGLRGDKYFNLAGFSPDPKTDKEKGIRQFKLKWNGRILRYYRMFKDLRTHD